MPPLGFETLTALDEMVFRNMGPLLSCRNQAMFSGKDTCKTTVCSAAFLNYVPEKPLHTGCWHQNAPP
jgi:hypothetical protein